MYIMKQFVYTLYVASFSKSEYIYLESRVVI